MRLHVDGPVPDLRAGRIVAEVVVAFPVLGRPHGSGNEAAAAVGTDIVQDGIHAIGAERAFIAANARVGGFRRQRLVAVLAAWPEFKHGVMLW